MNIRASTMSVVMRDSKSVSCYVKIGKQDCNLTLRFDRDGVAMLCGYPMSWGVYNVNVDYYDYESPTYEELEIGEQLDAIEHDVYVSRTDEVKILKKLQKCLELQFNDPDWSDHNTDEFRLECILQVENAINLIETYSDLETEEAA